MSSMQEQSADGHLTLGEIGCRVIITMRVLQFSRFGISMRRAYSLLPSGQILAYRSSAISVHCLRDKSSLRNRSITQRAISKR